MKTAFITGITGQDGSYLAELLLQKGYAVHGLVRRSSMMNTGRIEHLCDDRNGTPSQIELHYGDLTDAGSLDRALRKAMPDEVYHLGAQSHVALSFDMPTYTLETVGVSTMRLLDAVRNLSRENGKPMAFYQASSSEMYGKAAALPQSEKTAFYPRSPYACAKVFAYWQTVNYREAYGLRASNGIMFNHESPRRGENFVTRKITRGVARILAKKEDRLRLGNLDAKRDWGYAKDYVEAMWRMLQQPEGDDYVIATGECHSVKEFAETAFGLAGLEWDKYVEIDPALYRPTEGDILLGDSSKARARLNWEPRTSFVELVRLMLEADCRGVGIGL
jgi:GDPmannose 4,6-dehydratase